MKKPTITIAICALNEGPNIAHLLRSILQQRMDTFILEKILVISDGSTDDTVKQVQAINDARIEIKDYKERKGKSYRLNEIYGGVTSDIVVQPDADVILGDNVALEALIIPFADSKVGMTGGNPHPMKAETFIEKTITATARAYVRIREAIRNGNNIYTATGRLIALRKEVFQTIHVPSETISNDHFVYFCTLTAGYTFQYADKALVYFRLPQTLSDHLNQETRFSSAEYFMRRYFSPQLVDREYAIPRRLFLRSIIHEFFHSPIECVMIFIINSYCKWRAYLGRNTTNALWDVVATTKRLIKKPVV